VSAGFDPLAAWTVSPVVVEHPMRVALLGAELVANRLRARPEARLLLPTGNTPLGMYAALRAHALDGSLPTEQATLFQLDEYLGLDPDDARSYSAYLRRELSGIRFAARHELAGNVVDPEAAAAHHQAQLDAAPIDLAVLGLGRDGHVAFDEPGSTLSSGVRRVSLCPQTRADAAGEFGGIDNVPTEAITVGLRTLRSAREVLMLVSGAAKASALRAMLEGALGPETPASLLRDHPRLTIVCDLAAAAELRPSPAWSSDRVVVVLGHREPGISAEHRISEESRVRLHLAARLSRAQPPRAVVLTGYTRTGGLSEAEQMGAEWVVPSVPALLEAAGRNTAENASRSLPLIRALGGIRRVTVVTSAWHLRTRYFFAPYRATFGLKLSFRPAFGQGNWPRMLRQELRGVPAMRGQRCRAFAEARLPPEIELPPGAGIEQESRAPAAGYQT
jgi:glucosamine-6-phosphate deaminase